MIIQQGKKSEPKQESDLVFLYPRIFWMTFPSKDKTKALSQFLNTQFKTNYYIWNVSEHTYDTSIFNGQVINNIVK